jgi:tripartite-type tricarboxylate transporter receptor subunit TctC
MVRLLAAFLILIAGPAAAQGFPTKPVRMVIPFAAGGALDVTGRLIGQKLTELWGQQVVIDNRTGAGGNIGGDAVAKAAPDGHTLLLGTTGLLTINQSLYPTMPFDPAKDLAPVTMVGTLPNLMVVPPSLPVAGVQEFIAYAKARPGQLFFASPGVGSGIHLSGELFKQMAGIELTHTPYRGSAPALNDLMTGQVQVMFDNIPSALPLARDGRLKALAVTSPGRAAAIPELPTVAEAGLPGYETVSWFAMMAPAQTPPAILARLNTDITGVLGQADVKQRLADLGLTAEPGTAEALARFLAAETAKWSAVVKKANIKLD